MLVTPINSGHIKTASTKKTQDLNERRDNTASELTKCSKITQIYVGVFHANQVIQNWW